MPSRRERAAEARERERAKATAQYGSSDRPEAVTEPRVWMSFDEALYRHDRTCCESDATRSLMVSRLIQIRRDY